MYYILIETKLSVNFYLGLTVEYLIWTKSNFVYLVFFYFDSSLV